MDKIEFCKYVKFLAMVNYGVVLREQIKDGQPCGHPGCLAHVSHPCEGCGRIAGKGVANV